mgnify:CR=1 FL=1
MIRQRTLKNVIRATGVGLHTGSDSYQVTDNFVCGNFTLADGAGIAHFGFSHTDGNNGPVPLIKDNTVLFNENFNQGITVNGGGILVAGLPDQAIESARQAISTLREMGARVSECFSQITLAAALRRGQGIAAAGAIREALERARDLVDQTEARVYQPRILEEEARLAQLEDDQAAFDGLDGHLLSP